MFTDIVDTKPNTVLMKNRKQVKSACTNCRKSKTACSNSRPCERCKNHGLDDCQDIPRKKREKKKLEDDSTLLNLKDTFNFSPLSDSSSSDSERAFSDFIYESIPGYSSPPTEEKKLSISQISPNYFSFPFNAGHQYPTSCQPMIGNVQTPDLLLTHINQIKEEEDTEKEKLKLEIAQLKQSQTYLETVLNSLPHSFYYFCNKKEEGLSRWSILKSGYCQLIEYSSEFLNLTRKAQKELDNDFLCIFLYPPEFRGKTQILIDIIGSGRVTALTFQQLLDANQAGEGPNAVCSDVEVMFNGDGEPIQIVMRTREIDLSRTKDHFFTPLSIKFVNENKKVRATYAQPNANALPPPPPQNNYYNNAISYISPMNLQGNSLPAQPQMQMLPHVQHSLSCPVDFNNYPNQINVPQNNIVHPHMGYSQLIIDPHYC